jgi:hypothetical protein
LGIKFSLIISLQKVEEKEREEEKAGAKIVAKNAAKAGGRGAGKQRKILEVLPSPMGERVVPVVDDAYRKRPPGAIRVVRFSEYRCGLD